MSAGPTERLLRRARDWAADVEELSALQWRLFQLEVGELSAQLRASVWLFGAALAFGLLGAPLAVVAGLIMLAQAMAWPIANVLAGSGVIFVLIAIALWFAAQRSWSVQDWFPRSRRQAAQNLRGVFARSRSSADHLDPSDDEYYPD